jgi:hypothetical protein
MPGGGEDLHLARALRDVDLDLLVVELALAQHLAEALARGVGVVALDRGTPGRSASSTRSSATSSARGRAFWTSCSRVDLTAISTRSRTIESTSRPT